jgi:hypothetical protein
LSASYIIHHHYWYPWYYWPLAWPLAHRRSLCRGLFAPSIYHIAELPCSVLQEGVQGAVWRRAGTTAGAMSHPVQRAASTHTTRVRPYSWRAQCASVLKMNIPQRRTVLNRPSSSVVRARLGLF